MQTPEQATETTDPKRARLKEGCPSAMRATARLLVARVLLIAMISTVAQLAGCHITRQFPTAQAAPTIQPASCRQWDECA